MDSKQIAILGGTFDPVHNGHIQIANEVIKKLNFEQIIFIPNKIPPHKTSTGASSEHRLAMLKLALDNNKQFHIDTCELERSGTSYMVDTIILLQQKPEYANKNFWLILGQDVLYELPSWHNWTKLQQICNFIVIKRELTGDDTTLESDWSKEYLSTHKLDTPPDKLESDTNGWVYIIDNPLIPISATEIRQNLRLYYAKQDNLTKLQQQLPESVLDYITTNKLYT